MKKKTVRSKSAKRSRSRVSAKSKKGLFHKFFPLKFTFISVTVLGCLALILGGTYRMLPQSDVLGANATANNSKIYIKVNGIAKNEGFPAGDRLRVDVSLLQASTSIPQLISTIFFYQNDGVQYIGGLSSAYKYKFTASVQTKTSQKVSGYKVVMDFPNSSQLSLGTSKTTCGTASNPCRINVISSCAHTCISAQSCHGYGGQPDSFRTCSKAGTVCCTQ